MCRKCDTKSFFKQNVIGLNSKISFKTGCLTKAKETSLPYYSWMGGGAVLERRVEFEPFPKELAWNANSLVQGLH